MALHGYQRVVQSGQKALWENHHWLLGKMVTVHQLFGKENHIITMSSVGSILHREIRSGDTQIHDKTKRQTLETLNKTTKQFRANPHLPLKLNRRP